MKLNKLQKIMLIGLLNSNMMKLY